MPSPPLTTAPIDDGAIWRVTFGHSTGNVLDAAVMSALTGMFRQAATAATLRAVCLEGRGEHFSYGASVHEHRPDEVAAMLRRFDDLLDALLASSVVVIAAVRGRCLGGGLELASLCHRVVASRDATFGQPEIKLGVFAPVASVVLAERVGRGHAEDLCLSGRTINASEAHRIGLVDRVADADPASDALDYVREHLVPQSASSLRLAVKAGRLGLEARLRAELPAIERLYLEQLMQTHDAREGLDAFLGKRNPVWKNS
jgi:cyclohexa-1,5-dienecarbonyl-CoA hydratase